MKLKLKPGESIRLETDSGQPLMVYVEKGLIHVTAQPKNNPTRVVIADDKTKLEWGKA